MNMEMTHLNKELRLTAGQVAVLKKLRIRNVELDAELSGLPEAELSSIESGKVQQVSTNLARGLKRVNHILIREGLDDLCLALKSEGGAHEFL